MTDTKSNELPDANNGSETPTTADRKEWGPLAFLLKLGDHAGAVRDIGILLGVMLAGLYIVFPDFRRFAEVNITNRSAWYYIGRRCNGAKRFNAGSFYQWAWNIELVDFYRDPAVNIKPNELDDKSLSILNNSINGIAIMLSKNAVPGRTGVGGDKHRVVSAARYNECFKIHEIKKYKRKFNYEWTVKQKIEGVMTTVRKECSATSYYMHATRVSCG